VRKFIVLFLILSSFALSYGQTNDKLVQLSGVAVRKNILTPIPLTSVYNISNGRGTIADFKGYFSFAVLPGDTIQFSCIGYKTQLLFVEEYGEKDIVYSIIELEKDTIIFEPVDVFPWPSKEDFKEAFLRFDIPDDDYERARRNISGETLAQYREVLAYDGRESGKLYLQREAARSYYKGQLMPISILNPLKWAEFFNSIKENK
jgi:hypothetical protein